MKVRTAQRATRGQMALHRVLPNAVIDRSSLDLIELVSGGGDARIALDPKTGLNRYLSGPYPRDVLSYSSSTISDISPEAFAHLLERFEGLRERPYADSLAELRARLLAALDLRECDARIVFAPSGTDLEYVALACAKDEDGAGSAAIHNILLGADETGSGCIHSAHGRFFAQETALGVATTPAVPVAGCDGVTLVDVPVRCAKGTARASADVIADMAREIEAAGHRGSHSLVHVVHGSKTGLVLPALSDLDRLRKRFGLAITLVVDACQARITASAVRAYLDRDCIVLMTGSKFIGAPPFSGWALIPPAMARRVGPLPSGFNAVFRRAEWPEGWPGRGELKDTGNVSLALRLTAAVFELERFQAIPLARAAAVIDAFETAVEKHLIASLGARRVSPCAAQGGEGAGTNLIEMRTLITLDVSALPGLETFEDAQKLHRSLALEGVRLGQPVKCVRRQIDGSQAWGGTLRIGLSMPQMIRWAASSDDAVCDILESDTQRIEQAIRERLSCFIAS